MLLAHVLERLLRPGVGDGWPTHDDSNERLVAHGNTGANIACAVRVVWS